MTPLRGREAEIDAIFDRVLDSAPEARRERLEAECGGDDELRVAVERLLEHVDAKSPGFDAILGSTEVPGPADRLLAEMAGSVAERQAPPDHIGAYRVVDEIGRGGMGVVYRAERDDGQFEHRVALKLSLDGMSSAGGVDLFARERQIAATLSHPNIARLFDGGVAESGRPYFVMEYIEGKTIDRYADDQQLGVDERVDLFSKVARAVHYAHRNLVVHRDIKPSNILVTADGEPKLLDFGIAKLLAEPGSEAATVTRGQAMTPRYASPEQIRQTSVTTASDVYQLGLLLAELLTGRSVRDPEIVDTTDSIEAVERASRKRPSEIALTGARREAVASARGLTPKALERVLAGDLDAIVLTALRPEPDQRYPSAEAMARDLDAYRGGLTISALKSSTRYRLWKFWRRHRLGVLFGAGFLALLVAYAATVTVQARRIAIERDRVASQFERAERAKEFALDLFGVADPTRAPIAELSAEELLNEGAKRIEEELAGQPELQLEMFEELSRIFGRQGSFDRAEEIGRKRLDLASELHGEASAEVASALHDIGTYLLESDKAEAEAHLERALALKRDLFGAEDARYAKTLVRLGQSMSDQGRDSEGLLQVETALKILRAEADPDPSVLAACLTQLGLINRYLGNPERGVAYQREAAEIFEATFGPEHPDSASSWNNLATILWDTGAWQEGDEAMDRSLGMQRRLYGQQHPHIATSIGNYAGAFATREDYPRAVELYEEALAMRKELLGEDHVRTGQTTTQLAETLIDWDSPDRATELLQRAFDIFALHLPEGHSNFGRIYRDLGEARLAADQPKAAEEHFVRAAEIYEGADLPDRAARAAGRRGAALTAQARYAEAESLLLKSFEAATAESSLWRERHIEALVDLYTRWGRPDEADRWRRERAAPPDSPT